MQKQSRWWTMLQQRCPICGTGPIFSGVLAMHPRCPVCGLHFERERGYFMGALYVSYAIAIAALGTLMFACHLFWPSLGPELALLLAVLAYLPLMPVVYRYARVVWLYFDHWAWPERGSGEAPSA